MLIWKSESQNLLYVSLYIKKDKFEELIRHIENMEQDDNMANIIKLLI